MRHHHHHEHTPPHSHTHTHGDDVHTAHCDCGCGGEHGDNFEATKRRELTKIILAAVFFAVGWVCEEFGLLNANVALLCFAVSYVTVGFAVVLEALEETVHGHFFGECFLISVASLGALFLKEFGEGCAVMLLYAAGEYIQGYSLYKSRKRLREASDAHGFEHSHANSDTERFISKFARVYTPVICVLAIAIAVVPPLLMNGAWTPWLYRGLSVLVIGCPCAIVISVPLAFSCAIGACTNRGIYIHCTDALERLHKYGYVDEIVIPDGDAALMDYAGRAAKKAMKLATENVVFALAVKLAVLVTVIFLNRDVPMWLAEFSDVGVALLAILNSLRALRLK